LLIELVLGLDDGFELVCVIFAAKLSVDLQTSVKNE
jgi:hypothetical protein